jgi:hypothetical protein
MAEKKSRKFYQRNKALLMRNGLGYFVSQQDDSCNVSLCLKNKKATEFP